VNNTGTKKKGSIMK